MTQPSPMISTLVLSEHFLPDRGGTITWLFETYRRYGRGEVVVVAGERGDTRDLDETLPFKVERLPMSMKEWDPAVPASLGRYVTMIWHVLRSCRRHRIQQVHCMRVLPEGLIAWCVSLLSGLPYVVYAHGEEILIGLATRKLRCLIPKIYNGAAAVIANSGTTKTMLEESGVGSGIIHVIHPGVEAAEFWVEKGAALGVCQRHNLGDSPVLLTLGRLQRRKGQDMVIRALPMIKERFPTIKYLIVGSGEEHEALQRLAIESGVGDNVIFVGEICNEERALYYAACDIFVMPNRKIGPDIEGFGIAFLEASAAGKPVIGGRSGGTRDAIREGLTGILVDGEDVNAIVDAVIDLFTDSERAHKLGEHGRKWVEDMFSWEEIVHRTREVSSILAKGDEKTIKPPHEVSIL